MDMSAFCFKLIANTFTQSYARILCFVLEEGAPYQRQEQKFTILPMLDTRFDDIILFENLEPEQRTLVEPLFTPRQECTGTVLFKQGDPASCMFIVIEGEVHVKYKPEDGPTLIVARIRPESVVGWSAALGNPNYTSSAVCTTECTLLCVHGEDLRNLCEQHPDICPIILDRLAIMIAERLRNTHGHVIALLKQGLGINFNSKQPANQIQESS